MTAGVDVVIPVYGPGPHLRAVVGALERQSVPVARIIVSHSGAGDPASLLEDKPDLVILHSDERLFAGAARNRGLRLATTEWVAFVDEDIIVDSNWHGAVQTCIARGDADCVVGAIGYASSGGYWGMSRWFFEFSSVHPYLPTRVVAGGGSANMAVHRERFLSVGAFPEDWRMSEDTISQALMRARGYRIRFNRDVIGGHINVKGMRNNIRHLYHAGFASAKARRTYPQLIGSAAVKWPISSLGLWMVRLGLIYSRVLKSRHAPIASLLVHTPGILVSIIAWNIGFSREAFRMRSPKSDY